MAGDSERMKAIAVTGEGKGAQLELAESARPAPGPGEVLIQVMAAGVNRPDVLQRQGLYPAPKGHRTTLGLEASGTIAALGDGVSDFREGDAVMALLNGGGYGEYAVASAGSVLAKPESLSWVEAAALPETFFTVWHNVFERGALKRGERFLVHGGSSGIGVTAIQLAKAFGATVYATAGSDEKCAACRELGADLTINYRTEDFSTVLKEATGGKGVNVILDMVGGDYIDKNIRALAEDGRLVNIGYQQGSKATIDFMRVMLKRLTLTGSTLRVRSDDIKAGIARAIASDVLPKVVDGTIRIPIDSTFPLHDAMAAHQRMESSHHIGKIVLTVRDEAAA